MRPKLGSSKKARKRAKKSQVYRIKYCLWSVEPTVVGRTEVIKSVNAREVVIYTCCPKIHRYIVTNGK